MIVASAAVLMLLAFGAAAPEPRDSGAESRSVAVRQQIVIRVSRGVRPAPPAGASLIRWKELRGPRCVPAGAIAGATMLGPNSVDLVLRDNRRVRAVLERRCPALDYYYGFYVDATEDGQVCAERDFVRSRIGGECQIDEFRSLRAVRP